MRIDGLFLAPESWRSVGNTLEVLEVENPASILDLQLIRIHCKKLKELSTSFPDCTNTYIELIRSFGHQIVRARFLDPTAHHAEVLTENCPSLRFFIHAGLEWGMYAFRILDGRIDEVFFGFRFDLGFVDNYVQSVSRTLSTIKKRSMMVPMPFCMIYDMHRLRDLKVICTIAETRSFFSTLARSTSSLRNIEMKIPFLPPASSFQELVRHRPVNVYYNSLCYLPEE